MEISDIKKYLDISKKVIDRLMNEKGSTEMADILRNLSVEEKTGMLISNSIAPFLSDVKDKDSNLNIVDIIPVFEICKKLGKLHTIIPIFVPRVLIDNRPIQTLGQAAVFNEKTLYRIANYKGEIIVYYITPGVRPNVTKDVFIIRWQPIPTDKKLGNSSINMMGD